jgi:hypothetical protein
MFLASPAQRERLPAIEVAAVFSVVNVAFSWTPVFASEVVSFESISRKSRYYSEGTCPLASPFVNAIAVKISGP